MGHTEGFIHARGDGINGSGATDFIVKFGTEFFATSDDFLALFAIWVPGVFFFGAGFLAEGREGDLREAVFDDFVAFSEFVFFPVAELSSGLFDGRGDFCDLLVG